MKPKTGKTQSKQQQKDSPELLSEIRVAKVILRDWGNLPEGEDITPQGVRAILSALDTLIEAATVHKAWGNNGR